MFFSSALNKIKDKKKTIHSFDTMESIVFFSSVDLRYQSFMLLYTQRYTHVQHKIKLCLEHSGFSLFQIFFFYNLEIIIIRVEASI